MFFTVGTLKRPEFGFNVVYPAPDYSAVMCPQLRLVGRYII